MFMRRINEFKNAFRCMMLPSFNVLRKTQAADQELDGKRTRNINQFQIFGRWFEFYFFARHRP
jgi:hypothetical protein